LYPAAFVAICAVGRNKFQRLADRVVSRDLTGTCGQTS
jgi:hypothetical protein